MYIYSNSPDAPTTSVSLLGTGMTLPQLAVALPSPGSLPVNFGSVQADGPGKQLATQTITLSNTGQLPLVINTNGITLATGTQFKIAGITSSTQGTISLAGGQQTIAPNSAETWTVTLQFDPSLAAVLADTLLIASNDPTNPTTSVALSGTGLNQPALAVSSSSTCYSNLQLSFPPDAERRCRRPVVDQYDPAHEHRHAALGGGEERHPVARRDQFPGRERRLFDQRAR